MDDYALVLRLDLSDSAPEGPGWYIYATEGNNLLRKPQRIAGRNALDLAARIQSSLAPSQEMAPTQIIAAGNDKILQRIKDQIAYAEAQARRVGQLRRILQTESEQGE